MVAINKQDLINYLKKSPENINFNIFGTMLDDFRNTYETDEQIVDKIKNIIINIIEDGGSISPEDDTITELVDLITELLPEKMIIKPEGTLEITQNGEYDVMNKAGVDVEVPLPSGTIQITQNGNINVNDYEYANVNVVDPLGEFVKNNVTSFDIPSGVTSVGNKVFKDYTNLEEVTIPNSVTNLGSEAFSGCTNLATVNGGFGVQTVGENAFYNCLSVLSNGTTGDCKWAQYNGTLTIGEGENIGDYSFSDRPTEWYNNIKIIINNGVVVIGNYAFSYCEGLTSVSIPDSVTSIGGLAFSGCTGLTSVTIPDSVTSIGDLAFSGCTGLTDVYYTGTQEEWNSITIGSNNDSLTNATIHYNYTPSN